MRIVVDTNIAFSAILNTNSRIAQIFLQPRTKSNFYSTEQLLSEIEHHTPKLKKITKYTDVELRKAITLIVNRIRFINISLIPPETYEEAEKLTRDVDIDDTEFIALTEHIKGRFWSGDKELLRGLAGKGWTKTITTEELYKFITTTHKT